MGEEREKRESELRQLERDKERHGETPKTGDREKYRQQNIGIERKWIDKKKE